MQLPNDMPDHHDADLVIRLYGLRQEAVLRQSRQALTAEYWPRTAKEAIAVTRYDHPLNAAFRQVAGYWEMVFGMAKHGIVHADYLVENSGEGLFLFARIEPFLAELREASSPRAFQHTEWVAKETDVGRLTLVTARARVAQIAAARP